jgi:hypothetical protein
MKLITDVHISQYSDPAYAIKQNLLKVNPIRLEFLHVKEHDIKYLWLNFHVNPISFRTERLI